MFHLDDAVIGITSPMDYRYMKLLRLIMRIISGWPGRELGENCMRFEGISYAYYNTTLSLVYLMLGLWYLAIHINSLAFFDLGHMYIVLLMNILTVSRAFTLAISPKYRGLAIAFVRKAHLFYHKDKSEYSRMIHRKVHKFSHYFVILLSILMLIVLWLFNLIPMYNNHHSGKYKVKGNLQNTTFEHSIYLMLPFDHETNLTGYIVASIFIWYGSYLCASSIFMFDVFLSIMVFNLWGHFKILIHELETFPRPGFGLKAQASSFMMRAEKYSEDELKNVSAKLKQCIDYHRFILDFTNNMSDAFGLALFVYYMFHQVSGCLMLLLCSQLNPQALMRYLPLTLVMFQQLIQLSMIFETIGTMSEKLRDAVYEIPWECMDTKNRRTVWIFLMNVQNPIHVNAGGLVTVGVTTMASILKTSFSYFAFLRTVSE